MNAWGVIVIWGIVQVTAITLVAIACYALLRNRAPAARSQVIVVGLCVTFLVSILALSPWPRWVSLSPANDRAELSRVVAIHDDVRPSREATESPPLTAAQATTESKRDDANSAAVAHTFWQAFLRGLSEAPASPAKRPSLRWPAFVLLALALAAVVGAVRLLLGLWGVRRLCDGSQVVTDTGLHDEIARLRGELGCRRAVEARVSSHLASPVTVGWRRAFVILPNDWKNWSHSELQAALAHEIAHVARNDYAWGLVAQLCLAANYYHPLVHWLARRLRLAQELAADAAAAAATGSRNDYLMTLARLALRCDDRPVAWAARPFLPSRGSLLTRIDMLRDPRQLLARPMATWFRATIAGVLVAAGLLAAGVRGPTDNAFGAPPQDDAKKSDGLNFVLDSKQTVGVKAPFDVSQVPTDAQIVLAIRPWQLLTQKGLEPIAKLINESMEFEENFGVPVEEVDQFIFAGSSLMATADQGGPATRVIVRMRAPIDRDKFRILPGFESVAIGDKVLFTAPAGTSIKVPYYFSGAYFFLDDRTVVMSGAGDLRSWLTKPRPAGQTWNPTGWQDVQQKDAALWVDVKALRPGMAAVTREPNMTGLGPFAVLWEQTDTLIAGGTLDDMLRIRATAHCPNAENAERVEKTLAAAVTLGLNGIEAMKTRTPPGAETAPMRIVIDAGAKLLNQVKIARSQATIEATVEGPLDSFTVLAALAPSMTAAREAARRATSQNNMKHLALALHNYANAHGHFPPAVVLGPDGKTPHSWRVEILPYLEITGVQLHKQYKMDEPWDSDNNKKVLLQMPSVFRSPNDNEKSFHTAYFAVTGPQTIFSDEKGTKFQQITDGTSNTIMLVEAKRNIPWTKPEDIPVDADKPLPKLGGWTEGGFNVTLADGSVRMVTDKVDEEVLRALFTKAGREPVSLPQ